MNMRTWAATNTRVLKAQNRDLRVLRHDIDGLTINEISILTGEPRSYLKNALRRMPLLKKLEIQNNRTVFRWFKIKPNHYN